MTGISDHDSSLREMVPGVIRSTVQLPFQLVNAVLRRLRLVPGSDSPANHTFPVAGLDEARAHAVLYALRHAATNVKVRAQRLQNLTHPQLT